VFEKLTWNKNQVDKGELQLAAEVTVNNQKRNEEKILSAEAITEKVEAEIALDNSELYQARKRKTINGAWIGGKVG